MPLSVLLMLAGMWLFICMAALQYPEDLGNDPHLVEMGAGIIVFLTGLVRLSRPRGRETDLLVTVVGVGLILSGFFGDWGAEVIRWNQVASGCVLALLGLLGLMLAERSRDSGQPEEPREPGEQDGSTARTGSARRTARHTS
ncbi:hypothetical protein B0E37_03876 [Streptomyces sp. MH192]|nr:hypothetical protein [Streptomyces sp. MH192]MCF0101030.1 hypothetical protein [Streptomyces sp. MH191]